MDTSGLLKLFIAEKGSDNMLQFNSDENDRSKIVSALAQVEARSAISRLRRENRLTSHEVQELFEAITTEISRFIEQPIDSSVIRIANSLVDRHHLRALDAVQLASAMVARNLFAASDMRFIASDNNLNEAAQAEHFQVWDPTI